MKLGNISRVDLEQKCLEVGVDITSDGGKASYSELRERFAEKMRQLGSPLEDEARDLSGKIVDKTKITPDRTADTAEALRKEKTIRVKVLRTDRSGEAVPVSINGYQYLIQTGIPVAIPLSVYKVLAQAVEWKFNPNNPREAPMEVQSYPVEILDIGQ